MIGQYDYSQPVKGGHYRHRYRGAVPMTNTMRRAIYLAQNGGHRLTVAQERQLRRASNRDIKRASEALP